MFYEDRRKFQLLIEMDGRFMGKIHLQVIQVVTKLYPLFGGHQALAFERVYLKQLKGSLGRSWLKCLIASMSFTLPCR